MDKKGAEKYYIVISLILGLVVLGLSLYFIFIEYFTPEDLNWEACRQSVIFRNNMPDSQRVATASLENLRSNFPLKCKTEVVEVSSNPSDVIDGKEEPFHLQKTIADQLVQCWGLFGEGKYHLFPLGDWGGFDGREDCVICARIHFSEETVREYKNRRKSTLFLGEYLFKRDLNGNLLPSNFENLGGGVYQGKTLEGSYMSVLHFPFLSPGGEKLTFTEKERVTGLYGSRQEIDITQGDLLIGFYFYTDREAFETWKPFTTYRYSYPFYFQPSVEDLDKCKLQSIPA
jgi:hypothetical protein